MTAQRTQTALWGLFLTYYFASKYFVGGFTGFSVPYLISVIVLVLLTAVVPFYVARWLTGKLQGGANVIATLVLPTVLTVGGLALYFVLYIAPNYPQIQLPNIIHRAIEPGVAISVLLLIPVLAQRFSQTRDSHDSAENEAA